MKTKFSKRFATWVIAGIFPVLQGCVPEGQQTPVPVPEVPQPKETQVHGRHVDLRFHASDKYNWFERLSLEAAADAWQSQTGGMVRISMYYEAPWSGKESVLIPLPSTDAAIIQLDKDEGSEGSKTLGACWPDKGYWFIATVPDRVGPGPGLVSVAMHEFGHALGIGHLEQKEAIMFKNYLPTRKVCLTKWDLDAMCDKHDCTGWEMVPCEPEESEADGGG